MQSLPLVALYAVISTIPSFILFWYCTQKKKFSLVPGLWYGLAACVPVTIISFGFIFSSELFGILTTYQDLFRWLFRGPMILWWAGLLVFYFMAVGAGATAYYLNERYTKFKYVGWILTFLFGVVVLWYFTRMNF